MVELAIYDMDRTITRSGTYTPWLIFWAWRRAPWRLLLLPLAGIAMLAYVLGLVTRKRLKEINQTLLMGGRVDPARVARTAEAYAEQVMRGGVYPDALAQISADKAAGRRVILATASYAFYVEPLSRRFGINEVIATRSKVDDRGRILARIDADNCYGAGKMEMVETYLAAAGIDRSQAHVRFYSDHFSDKPVFDWSDEPIAVNASAALRAHARQHGWTMIDWH
ncbi:MAG: HAD-IB family phosphatase [Sphingomonadaceae bacterium]|nr:HAD-IB family phosphatase [Sphingomonadaceae bacterium]